MLISSVVVLAGVMQWNRVTRTYEPYHGFFGKLLRATELDHSMPSGHGSHGPLMSMVCAQFDFKTMLRQPGG